MNRKRLVVRLALVVGALAVVVGVVSARYFVWPTNDQPTPADAIVVLGGDGERYNAGAGLAQAGMAPVMVMSTDSSSVGCPGTLTAVPVICFVPDPYTTQGEARYIADLARERGWQHLIVVTSAPQSERAALRLERCFHGQVDVQTVDVGKARMVRDVIYEWGATAKALVLERDC